MYQILFIIFSGIIAISNLYSAIFIYRFVKDTMPRIRNMDRAMAIIKYDILKRKSDAIKKAAQGNRVREAIKDEDSFKNS